VQGRQQDIEGTGRLLSRCPQHSAVELDLLQEVAVGGFMKYITTRRAMQFLQFVKGLRAG